MNTHQYSIANHTILPLIYRILHPEIRKITYLLKEPKTNALLMLGSTVQTAHQVLTTQQQDLQQIQQLSKCKLEYIFFNFEDLSQNIYSSLIPTFKSKSIITSKSQGNLRPLIVGDYSICFIDANGYKNPFSLIAVTHFTSSSTKIPVLFPGTLISLWYLFSYLLSSIDLKSMDSVKSKDYLSSLDKIKYFPNETYIFPTCTVSEEDLLFAKLFIKSSVIDQKIQLFNQNKQFGDALIPTSVLEQKIVNPFINADKYSELLGTLNKQKAFDLLRRARQQFKKE